MFTVTSSASTTQIKNSIDFAYVASNFLLCHLALTRKGSVLYFLQGKMGVLNRIQTMFLEQADSLESPSSPESLQYSECFLCV